MATLLTMASLAGSAFAAYPGLKSVRQATDAANVTVASNMTLTPINCTTPEDENPFVAQSNVTLPYGLNDTNYVNITLTVPSAILLEAIESLTNVDCSADSLTVSFNSTDSLDAAFAAWSAYTDLVLITNHLGDCDTEYERGFFVAASFAVSDSTIVATAEKTNVTSIASHMRANFTGIPGQSSTIAATKTKRDIIIDPDAVSVSTEWDLTPSLTLYEYDPYVTATANSGSLALGVTLDGYLDFDIWTLSLEALYVDAATTVSADLELELAVTAPYSDTFSYSDGIEYYVVDVPGILTFGPELSFAVGATVDVDAAIDVILDIGAEIANGTIHLDFVGDGTAAEGWTPTYHADLTLSEEATVGLTPFVSVTVGLDFTILGGLLDLSGGLTPKVDFPITATLNATQVVSDSTGTNVTVTQVGADGTCSNGVEVVSEFEFTLDAFLTEFWDMTLYSVEVAIADECYTWT
ncbi:hypothetical protein N0V93_000433 [Gnomoniopsis smithogilvyi]|uniref:DUF7029 domain-containing protein n=1 Tax=Gnomoniopsis smithogilvyi TaxID=1191159 RepID=A0A9W9D1D1_9PEZI|nr:hypothetical protein N0V93_000433 [Gnomoniopsis smithogilvyi]